MSGKFDPETMVSHVAGEIAALRATIDALIATHPDRPAFLAAFVPKAQAELDRIHHWNARSHERQRAESRFLDTLDLLSLPQPIKIP